MYRASEIGARAAAACSRLTIASPVNAAEPSPSDTAVTNASTAPVGAAVPGPAQPLSKAPSATVAAPTPTIPRSRPMRATVMAFGLLRARRLRAHRKMGDLGPRSGRTGPHRVVQDGGSLP